MASNAAILAASPYAEFFTRPVDDVASDLESFAQLLGRWQRVQNLVSRETLADVWTRHIADSLQLLKYTAGATRVLDLGSGGGFPAVPMAIAIKSGEVEFVLVEPNARKASFLRAAARDLKLDLRVETARAEDMVPRETFPDVITSRALAPLGQLLRLALPFFGSKTRAILHKGREHVEELAESAALWHYDVIAHKSDTDPSSVLLEIWNLRLRSST
jgi:16S rRNA (guanine527-N7)-methyltransferase